MRQWKLRQFVLLDIKDGVAIQNEVGFTVINDIDLISFFKRLDDENRLELKEKMIVDYFGEKSSQVISFLIDSKLIVEVKEKTPYSAINILTNDFSIYESMQYNLGQDDGFNKIEYVADWQNTISELKKIGIDEDKLYLIVFNPFDYIFFEKLADTYRELNAFCIFVFAYDSVFYMSNLYKHEWYNSCPKCLFSHIEMGLRAKADMIDTPTFQTIVDLIYSKNPAFKVELPVNRSNVLALVNEVASLKNTDINWLSKRIAKINLLGKVVYDQCAHWELCDCFE